MDSGMKSVNPSSQARQSLLNRLRQALSILYVVFMTYGCTAGSDQLEKLAMEFPRLRGELIELRGLITRLDKENGIAGFRVGHVIRYNDQEVKEGFWLREKEGLYDFAEVSANQPISTQSEISRLRNIAQRIGCEYVTLREKDSLWVAMSYGGTFAADAGYMHLGALDIKNISKGKFLAVPGETEWYVFER